MAADFRRIGGEIISAPLNENFRKLRNDISMANTNLVFSDTDGVKSTIAEMLKIEEPRHSQVCYVISSGELYRYGNHDKQWHKIADFGQTHKQNFLNSGVVVMNDRIKMKQDAQRKTLLIPGMLVYYKTLPGDQLYLGGMYRVDAREYTPNLTAGSTYSIYLDEGRNCYSLQGLPKNDDPDRIFLGTVSVDKEGKIMEDFVFTIPDIAYTADRGLFYTSGGQISGLGLTPDENGYVNRNSGMYYDEGINVVIGNIEDFPINTDNGSNFNVKFFSSENRAQLSYIYPSNTLGNVITSSSVIIKDKYYNGKTLDDVPAGYFTIQKHLVTPNGKNLIVYGDKLYNSAYEAEANLNTTSSLSLGFPYVEVTRMIVGNEENFSTDNKGHFNCYTLSKLAQVGTVDPEFADNEFLIYAGSREGVKDSTPASIRFDLTELSEYNEIYTLRPKTYNDTEYLFGISEQYTENNNSNPRVISQNYENIMDDNTKGYIIPTQHSVDNIQNRLKEIETELWKIKQVDSQNTDIVLPLNRQGMRYRLENDEEEIKQIKIDMSDFQDMIDTLHQIKVSKTTTINGHTLGDRTDDPDETKTITLKTGDIEEGTTKPGQNTNLWFRVDRVLAIDEVDKAIKHSNATGNPHKTTTDELVQGTNNWFASSTEKPKLAYLPANTTAELAKKMEGLAIKTIGGNSHQETPGAALDWGDVTALRFYTDGINLHVDPSTKLATIECVGQADPEDFLKKTQYAVASMTNTDYAGYVDKALVAKDIESLANLEGTALQYYGTNINGNIGTYDLPVTTGDVKTSVNVETVAFAPYDHSITLKHLADGTVIYTHNNEEEELQTNVYDLVRNHYHKVYNSGVQEEYNSEGEIILHDPYYNYIIPFGGLSERAYYFTHNNVCYTFTPEVFLPANTELRFYPQTAYLVYVNSGAETEIECTSISGDLVETDYLLRFVSSTDWNCINEWNFGDNLTVSVINGRATINAKDVSKGAFESHFANLADVNVDYKDTNLGKLLQLSKDANGQYNIQLQEVPLQSYISIKDYVADSVNHIMNHAALADVSTSANTLQEVYTVDDSKNNNISLWSASRIINYVDTQINNIHKIHYGVGTPSSNLGNEGDIYIMLEG